MVVARLMWVWVLGVLASLVMLAGCEEGEAGPVHVVDGGLAARGAAAIERYGCGTCHVIPGIDDAIGTVGPPLTQWAERQFIAGAVVNQPDNLIRWIRSPHSIEPGTAMPDLGIGEADARDIAAYLYTIGDATALGPPHPLPERLLHVR